MSVPGTPKNADGEEALRKLLVVLNQVQEKVDSYTEDDYLFLVNVLQNRKLRSLVQVYSNVLNHSKLQRVAVATNLLELVGQLVQDLSNKSHIPEVRELCHIFASPHLQAVLVAHDEIAQKSYIPKLPEIQPQTDEGEETVKIVQLVKSNEPLGATIKMDMETKAIIIARILRGGAADRSGLISVGDEVHEVNGINVHGKSPTEVLKILQSQNGTILLKLIPTDGRFPSKESKVRVRAHFDYDPKEDSMIPCKDAGIFFRKGEILHIVCQNDPNWWQARREGDRNMRAGLIPGRLLQERRILSERNVELSPDEEEEDILTTCKGPSISIKKNKKTKKIMYEVNENEDYDREEIATYEEVACLYPRHGIYRPIILIGPPGVGRNELKRRLMALDPDHYVTTIPQTSRPKRPNEINGKEYCFVSRECMEDEIRSGGLVEYGEYKGNLYGTSVENVKAIINSGSVCVMSPHPQALKRLRVPELKPYVIFIKPPSFERFKETRYNTRARSTFDQYNSRGFTNEEFHEIIKSAMRIEFLYGHWYDATVVNDDLLVAFEELLDIVRRVENEPQWVPASWVS
ncbi:hypothetical protein CHUAL_002494 [Chamberlinius hualienensis]